MAMPGEVREWCVRTGRTVPDGLPPPELVQEYDAMVELGLVEAPFREPRPGGCTQWMEEPQRFCLNNELPGTERCVYHGGARMYAALTAQQQRDTIIQALLPQSVQRLAEVLHDDEAKDEVVVRAAFGIMDRVGLGPVQGILLDANVNHRVPREQLAEMLGNIADRLGPEAPVLDVEVVDDEAEAPRAELESSEAIPKDAESSE